MILLAWASVLAPGMAAQLNPEVVAAFNHLSGPNAIYPNGRSEDDLRALAVLDAQASGTTAESLITEMTSSRMDMGVLARKMGSLSAPQYSLLIRELDRREGASDEKAIGAIGFAVQALAKTVGQKRAADVIIGVLGETDLTPRLQRELIRNIELWTNLEDIEQVTSVVRRLSALQIPTGNDRTTVDYGLAGLLQRAIGYTRRSGRDVDAQIIVELAASRIVQALPVLIDRATEEEALPGYKGATTFGTFSGYRRVLGEDFDKALVAAFVAENTAIPKQLAIMNRMWPTEEKPPAIRGHLAALSNLPVPSEPSALPTATPSPVR